MDAFVANVLRGHSAQGQTVPLYLGCRVDGREVVYQTKLAGKRSGLSPRELGIEMIGTTLAHAVGLHVARPAMITLPPDLLRAVESDYQFGVSDATAFGCVWKPDLTPFLAEVERDQLSEAELAKLLALDLLLANGDRTQPNPNVAWDGDRLLIFDFEHCLELPGQRFDRRLAVHLESLSPLWKTHLATPRVTSSALRQAMESLLDEIVVDEFRRDAYALPKSWHDFWSDVVHYLGYIQNEPGPLFDRIETLTP